MKKKIATCTLGIVLLSGCGGINNFDARTSLSSTTTEQFTPEEQAHQELLKMLPEEADTDDWNLILVNETRALPEDFEAPIVELEAGKPIDERIIEPYQEWREAGLAAGIDLYFASGYRSIELQKNNFNHRVEEHLAGGATEKEAIEKTKVYIALPGHSEHHTGLAMDIIDHEFLATGKALHVDFGMTDAYEWMIETMTDYGFILRYPEGKEDMTGIAYEPWHYRYVGKENAQFMVEHDLSLEEYVDLLEEREAMVNG